MISLSCCYITIIHLPIYILTGELPNLVNYPLPSKYDCYAIPKLPYNAPITPKEKAQYETILEQIASKEEVFNHTLYNRLCKQVNQKNAELHSMRCDMKLKLWVAEKFLDEEKLYFPHNIDFRGRAYPIPQNLNHMGGDLCRGLLTFGEGKALGKLGLKWLKVHLCNLFGNNKMSRDDRVQWVDDHMDDVMNSALYPTSGDRWWSEAENPFQALATCIEISNAIGYKDGPEEQWSSALCSIRQR